MAPVKRCPRCGTTTDDFAPHVTRGSQSWCRGCTSEQRQQRRQRVKSAVVAAYGGRCFCCGERDIRFLTIDHVDGGGTTHRKKLGGGRTYFVLENTGFPSGYQVACWNCNSGRHINGGVCPHQEDQ